MAEPHLLLFDLYEGGHHVQYLRVVADGWRARRTRGDVRGRLTIVVPPGAPERRPALAALDGDGVTVAPLDGPVEMLPGGTLGEQLHNERQHARHLVRALRRHRPTHALLMYMDDAQLALAFGVRPPDPVVLGGILFGPRFHYARFGAPASTPGEYLRRLRQRGMLWAALRNPRLRRVFCLDPYLAPPVDRLAGRACAVPLPDGLPDDAFDAADPADRSALRTRLGLDADAFLVLLFGSLAARKGAREAVEAVRRLPEAVGRGLTLALVGAVPPAERDALRAAVADARGAARIVLHDAFVAEEDVQDHFRAADLVLLPYQRHVGSSGVLLRAAAAGVPVVAADYGLVGAHVRRHRLGAAVDAARPERIASAVAAFRRGEAPGFDADAARAFARANAADAMVDTLFAHLGVAADRHAR